MIYTPWNAFTWTLGSFTMYTSAFKSWRTYNRNKNPLAIIYFWITFTLGVAFFFFGVPALLSNHTQLLKYTYFLADVFVQCSMQAMAWLVWFIGLRKVIRLRVLLISTSLFSLGLLGTQLLTSEVSLSQNPHLVVYTDHFSVLLMKSVIYLAVALPLGYFILRQVPTQPTRRAQAKSFLNGLIFIVVSLAATYNNIFDKGSDTTTSTTILALIFAAFLAVSLVPSARPSTST